MRSKYYKWDYETGEVLEVSPSEVSESSYHANLASDAVGLVAVSTSFFASDLFNDKEEQVVFETIIFPIGRVWGRYKTPAEARAGHAAAVAHYKKLTQEERDEVQHICNRYFEEYM